LLAAWEGDGFKPGWDVSELEMRLARSILGRAFDADTRPAERPGRSWTLASTLVLAGKGRNLAVHNLLNDWLDRTDELARHSCNWKAAGWLVLAVDGRELTRTPDYDSVTAAEYYSRLVRVAEEYLALPPGATLPFRVAVLVVSPGEGAGRSDLTPEEVESLVRKHDPALAALLTRTAAPGGVAYFGGMVPRGKSLAGWASQAAGVLAG
jgi:hypothetical protein